MSEAAKEKENKSGKREVERKGEGGFQERCANASSRDVFKDCCSLEGSESFCGFLGHSCGGSCGFSVRVLAGCD